MKQKTISPRKLFACVQKLDSWIEDCRSLLEDICRLNRQRAFGPMNKKIKRFTKFFVVAIILSLDIASSRLSAGEENVKRRIRKKIKNGFAELLKIHKKLLSLPDIEEVLLRKIIVSIDECRKSFSPGKHEQYLNEMIVELVYRADEAAKDKPSDPIPGLGDADEA